MKYHGSWFLLSQWTNAIWAEYSKFDIRYESAYLIIFFKKVDKTMNFNMQMNANAFFVNIN